MESLNGIGTRTSSLASTNNVLKRRGKAVNLDVMLVATSLPHVLLVGNRNRTATVYGSFF